MRYVQNQSTLEIHCVHDDGATHEQCNTDQIEQREELEEADALRIVAGNPVRRCEHCWPRPKDPKED